MAVEEKVSLRPTNDVQTEGAFLLFVFMFGQ